MGGTKMRQFNFPFGERIDNRTKQVRPGAIIIKAGFKFLPCDFVNIKDLFV
jgi:acetoin utilization deacetylase AcuC-like enzyme